MLTISKDKEIFKKYYGFQKLSYKKMRAMVLLYAADAISKEETIPSP